MKSKARTGANGIPRFRGQLRSEQFHDFLVGKFQTMAAGAKIASERDLALESGLSLLTVNKVLVTLVAEGLVERRRGQGSFIAQKKVAQATGATPTTVPSGAPVSANGLKLLRFITREPERVLRPGSRDYVSLFYRGVREASARDGFEVMLTPFELFPDGSEALPENTFASASIEGAFFVECGVPDYRRLWRFLEDGRRIVAFDFAAPERGLNSVVFDNTRGTRDATEHCLAHGHLRLAYVAPAGNVGQPGDERLAGFRHALADAGIDPAAAPLLLGTRPEILAAVRQQLARPLSERPSAFVCFMDDYADAVREAAVASGLRVPGDVSVVGFGGSAESARSRGIDTIAFDEVEMGRMAFGLWKSTAKGLARRSSGRLIAGGSVSYI